MEFSPLWLTTRPPDVNSELQKRKGGFSEKTGYSAGSAADSRQIHPCFPKSILMHFCILGMEDAPSAGG
jgi:hypothetical protein